MPRKTSSVANTDSMTLPVVAYLELQAFHDELVGIARTIDPEIAAGAMVRKHEQQRRRALAKVFGLWAAQVGEVLRRCGRRESFALRGRLGVAAAVE